MGPDAALQQATMAKIEEGLAWWAKAKDAARRTISGSSASSSGAELMKDRLKQHLEKLFQVASALEQNKITGSGVIQLVKRNLDQLADGLVNLQEMCRGIHAMG